MNFKVVLAAAALLASQTFAIVGIGGHYAPGFGTKLKSANKEKITDGIEFDHGGFSGTMQGFGFKLWLDILPIIDIEATYNIQFGSYKANLYVNDPMGGSTKIPLDIELGGTPFGKASPKFVAMNGDLSITYPVTCLPIIRPYIGGGLTYYLNTTVLNKKFVTNLIDDPKITGMIKDLASMEMEGASQELIQQKAEELSKLGDTLKERIQDAATDESINTSIGGHVLVGLRAKLPVIPIAAYANFKYYIGGDYPSEIDSGNMAIEVGGGFAL